MPVQTSIVGTVLDAADVQIGGGCEFGVCGFVGPGFEQHHTLPQQFKQWFEERGLDIEEYKVLLDTAKHRLRVGRGVHTKEGGDWNGTWRKWIEEHPNASREQVLNRLKQMMADFGIIGGDLLRFSDFVIMVNPCLTGVNLPSCNEM